jgi:cyclophilin family peptidyl-prolyl cis-trans isomerase
MIALIEATTKTAVSSSNFFGSSSNFFYSDSPSTNSPRGNNNSNSTSSSNRPKIIFLCIIVLLVIGSLIAASSVMINFKQNENKNDNDKNSPPIFDLLRHKRSDPRHDSSHHIIPDPRHNSDSVENSRNAQPQQQQNQDHENDTKNNNILTSSSSNNNNTSEKNNFPVAKFFVKGGAISIRLRPDAAPKTVENFIRLIREGAYNKTGCAYRYERGFVMQFGLCSRIDHKTVPLEYKLPNSKYSVSMARSSNPNSGGTEFFINLANNTRGLGPSHKGGYAVFGEVIDGFDVIQELKKLPVHSSAGKDSKTGRSKKGGLMLFDKPVPHFSGVVVID